MANYLHPTITSFIIDKSETFFENNSDDTTKIFGVITSDKGEANVIKTFYNSADMLAEYGEPDYTKHGYVYYNLLDAVKNGAAVSVMRVVPIDNPDRPEVLSGSYANTFLDIQTKLTAAVPMNLATPLTNGVDHISVFTDDVDYTDETKVSAIDGASAPTQFLTVDHIRPGSTVYFNENVFSAGSMDVKTMFWATSTDFSVVGLSVGSPIDVKASDGTLIGTATISAQSGTGGINKYSLLLESTSNITTTDQVLLESAGNVVGYASSIKLIARVYGASEATATYDQDLSSVTAGNAGEAVILRVNGTDINVDLSTVTANDANSVKTLFDNAINSTTFDGTCTTSLNGSNQLVIDTTSVTQVSTIDLVDNSVAPAGADDGLHKINSVVSNIIGSAIDSMTSIDNIKNDSLVTLTGGNSGVFRIFSGKAVKLAEFYIEEVQSGPALADDTITGIDVRVDTIVTASRDIDTDGFNIVSFKNTPINGTLLFFEFEGTPERVEVRPTTISKRTDSVEELKSFLLNPTSDPLINETDDGFKRHIFFGISKGMSKNDNVYGFRLTNNSQYDEDSEGFRFYNIEILEKIGSNESVIDGPFITSFDPNATDIYGGSVWIESTLSRDTDKLSHYFNKSAYDKLLEDLGEASVNAGETFDPGNFDFIFGAERVLRSRSVDEARYIHITDEKFVGGETSKVIGGTAIAPKYTETLFITRSFSVSDGILYESVNGSGYTTSGSSGSLDGYDAFGNVLSSSDYLTLRSGLLVDAFNGVINPDIFDKKSYPFDIIIDGKESTAVKLAINDFVNNSLRSDCIAMLDTGENNRNYSSEIAYRKNELATINSFYTAIFGQGYRVYDTYTDSVMNQSIINGICNKIAQHDKNNGTHIPMAGPRGVIDGYMEDTLTYSPNENQMEELYNSRVNYISKSSSTSGRLMSQNTSQYKNSALTNISVVRTLLQMKRMVDKLAENYQWSTYNVIASNFQTELSTKLGMFVTNGACEYVKPTIYASEYDRRTKKARIRIKLKFSDLIESFIINWEVTF